MFDGPLAPELDAGERRARLRLARTDRIGAVHYHEALAHFGSARAACRDLHVVSESEIAREEDALAKHGGSFLVFGDAAYPTALAALPDAPPVLSAIGDIGLLTRPALAIVGARDASVAGRRFAARLASELGAAGFAIASVGDFESVKTIAETIGQRADTPVLASLSRANPADILRSAEALRPAKRRRIHIVIATSDLHMKHKLQMEPDAVIDVIARSVTHARNLRDDVEWSAEDATRSDRQFLRRAIETAIKAGATTINLPDTVGYATPAEYRAMFEAVRARVPNADTVTFSTHCHDDLGLAVANSIAAVQGGARQVECTVNGIGERAGNASLEEIVMAFKVRQERLPFTTGIDTRQLYPSSEMLTQFTGQGVQVNKAIVGRNAFAHEAGIHQHGMLANPLTYEIMDAQSVGLMQSELVLGKHSGRHAVQKRCEQLGYTLSRQDVDAVYRKLTALADTPVLASLIDVASLRERVEAWPWGDPSEGPGDIAIAIDLFGDQTRSAGWAGTVDTPR